MVTAGCGLTNAMTGLCLAAMTNSAVVCVSGQHPNTEDHQGSFQEAYGTEMLSSFAKYTKRVTDWSTIEFDMRLAFREAITPPQGVALVEIPQNILYHHNEDKQQSPAGCGLRSTTSARPATPPRSTARSSCWRRRTSIDRWRGWNFLVAGWSRTARVRRAYLDSRLRAARRARRGLRGASAGDSRRLQKTFYWTRRRRAHAGLPLLERRAFRPPQDLERQGEVHPGRSDAEPYRMAGAGGSSAGRRSQAGAAPVDQPDKGTQTRLFQKPQLAVAQGIGRGPLQFRAAGDRELEEVSDQPPDPSGAARSRPGLGARQELHHRDR